MRTILVVLVFLSLIVFSLDTNAEDVCDIDFCPDPPGPGNGGNGPPIFVPDPSLVVYSAFNNTITQLDGVSELLADIDMSSRGQQVQDAISAMSTNSKRLADTQGDIVNRSRLGG